MAFRCCALSACYGLQQRRCSDDCAAGRHCQPPSDCRNGGRPPRCHTRGYSARQGLCLCAIVHRSASGAFTSRADTKHGDEGRDGCRQLRRTGWRTGSSRDGASKQHGDTNPGSLQSCLLLGDSRTEVRLDHVLERSNHSCCPRSASMFELTACQSSQSSFQGSNFSDETKTLEKQLNNLCQQRGVAALKGAFCSQKEEKKLRYLFVIVQ